MVTILPGCKCGGNSGTIGLQTVSILAAVVDFAAAARLVLDLFGGFRAIGFSPVSNSNALFQKPIAMDGYPSDSAHSAQPITLAVPMPRPESAKYCTAPASPIKCNPRVTMRLFQRSRMSALIFLAAFRFASAYSVQSILPPCCRAILTIYFNLIH